MSSNAMPPAKEVTHGSPSTPKNFRVATARQLTSKLPAAFEDDDDDDTIDQLINSFPLPPKPLKHKSNVNDLRREASLSAENSPISNRKQNRINHFQDTSFQSGSPQLPPSPLAQILQAELAESLQAELAESLQAELAERLRGEFYLPQIFLLVY
jgi:hypothetical protein